MKTIAKKLSALLLCLLIFSFAGCKPNPVVGETVKTEYLTYEVQVWESKQGAYIRLIPICDIENLSIIVKVYDAEKLLLQQNVRELGNVVGQQEYIYSIMLTSNNFYEDKLLDSVVIEAKSGTVTGI